MKKIKNLKVSIADHLIFLVYFGFFVGGGVGLNEIHQSKIAQMLLDQFGEIELGEVEKVAVIKDVYKVHFVKGDVKSIVTETKEVLNDTLTIDTVIQSGQTVKTGSKSLLILKFGADEKSFLKIGSNSEVLLKYEMGEGERVVGQAYNQITNVLLKIGSVLFDIKDKYPEGNFLVKTQTATMGIRGTTFIASQEEGKSGLLLVREGLVEMVNSKSFKKKLVGTDQGFVLYNDGVELKIDPAQVSPIWGVLDERPELIDDNAVNSLEKPTVEEEKKEVVKIDKKEEVDLVKVELEKLASRMSILLENFSTETEKLKEKRTNIVESNKVLANLIVTTKNNLEQDLPFIEEDLTCLESDKKSCKLNKEALLRKRGYLKITFSKKGRKGMYDDLVLYVEEQEEIIRKSQEQMKENDKQIASVDIQILNAQNAYKELTSLDMNKDLKKGIKIYRDASEKSGFENLLENIKNVEKAFNSYQL